MRLSDPWIDAEDDDFRSQHMRGLIQHRDPTASRTTHSPIPRTIVQFWHDADDLPEDVRECMDSWEPLTRRGFDRVVFDDQEARQFISARFGSRQLDAFDRCPHPAMRCDYFRMCYLLALGGFYVDADEAFQGGDWEALFVDDLLKVQPLCFDTASGAMVAVDEFTCVEKWAPTWIYYVNNNPIITPPEHPILQAALDRSTRILAESRIAGLAIQSATGPGNLTASLVAHSIAGERIGASRDFMLLQDWESLAVSRWPLSYRNDERNWRLWDPSM